MNYTTLALLFGVLFMFAPALETKWFPAAAPMTLHQVALSDDGENTVFYGSSNRLRQDCNFVDIEWWLGSREGRHVPANLRTGPPKVRGNGAFSFGPWIVDIIPTENFKENSYADAVHRCKTFGFPNFWLTRSRFWK